MSDSTRGAGGTGGSYSMFDNVSGSDNPVTLAPRNRTPNSNPAGNSGGNYGVFDSVIGANHVDTPLTQSTETTIPFSTKDYPYLKDPEPTENSEALDFNNANSQPAMDKIGRGLEIAGANAASSFGQTLAGTFDLAAAYKTAKGEVTGSNDDFNSHLFGLSTKDMMDWSTSVQKNNPIYEQNPGSFSPGDLGWWTGEILPQLGTLVGTGVAALGTTAAIEAATGGAGTGIAALKLASNIKKMFGAADAAGIIAGGMDLAKGMQGAAAIYATIGRYSEARFEAQNNYDRNFEQLGTETKPDGTPFSDDEKQKIASAGARTDFNLTIAQLPLDILAMRAMIFNPLTNEATGVVERGLGKVAGAFGTSALGKTAGWLTTHAVGSAIEGGEGAAIPIFQNEGDHHAKVLAGLDSNDDSTLGSRISEQLGGDEVKNMVASGVLGSLLIGPAMNGVRDLVNYKNKVQFNDSYKTFLNNIPQVNSDLANNISTADQNGDTVGAANNRRRLNANMALQSIHMDTLANKTNAHDSWMNFLNSTLDQANSSSTNSTNANTDPTNQTPDTNNQNIKDLFGSSTPDQINQIKNEYKQYISDAQDIKDIYNTVGQRFNRNITPMVTNDQFQLKYMTSKLNDVNANIEAHKNTIFQYNQLSPQGKEIHDMDYQLQVLNAESSRLTSLYKGSDNTLEQQNIQKTIDDNTKKKTDLSDRLEEIQKDESYDPATKQSDNLTLSSMQTLHSMDYAQALYDKESLENSINIQKGKLALWNNPKYIKDIALNSVKKANTQEVLKNSVAATTDADTGKPDPEVQRQANQKATTIEATTEPIDNTQVGNSRFDDEEGNVHAEDIMKLGSMATDTGNSSLGEDDYGSNDINDTNDNTPSTFVGPKGDLTTSRDEEIPDFHGEGNVVASFSPVSYDFNKSSDDAKAAVKNAVGGLLNKLDDKASFEDLAREFAKLKGLSNTDNIFEALKYGYRANGKELTEEDANFVYDKMFGDPADALIQAASQLIINTPDKLRGGTTEVTDSIIAGQDQPEGFDNNNIPIYNYRKDNNTTDETSPKAAFISRPSRVSYNKNEDGTTQVDYEYTGEVGEGNNEWINSDSYLDPDRMSEGTAIEIKIPKGVDRIPVPIFKANGEYSKSILFGQWVAEQSAIKDMSLGEFSKTQEYKDKVPMMHYPKDFDNGGKGLSFVHDVGWYAPSRFVQSKPDDMAKAIQNTREIREEVLNSLTNSVPATITGKRQTTFEGLLDKNKDNPLITIQEANPQAQLMVIMSDGTPHSSRKTSEFPNNNGTSLANNVGKDFKIGQVVDVRRYGVKDGSKTFIASPIFKNKISPEIQSTVKNAIYVYIDSKNPAYQSTIKNIQSSMGLDITTRDGLRTYLNHFIRIEHFSGANSTQDVDKMAKDKLALGTPFMTFIGGGNLVFGQAGVSMYTDNAKKSAYYSQYINDGMTTDQANALATEKAKVYSRFLNNNSPQTAKKTILALAERITVPERKGNTIENTPYNNRLAWFDNNMDIDNYSNNNGKPIVTINKDSKTGTLNTNTVANNYHDYLMKTFTTNFKSYNIGTDEKPNYVSNIQPIVTYDTNSRLSKQIGGDVKEQIEGTKENKIDTNIIPAQQAEVKIMGLSDEIRAKMEESMKRLGIDLNTNKNNVSLSPMILTETQKNDIANDLDDIGGLDPIDQYTVVNSIFNDIISKVNFDSGKVTKADLQREIKNAFTNNILSNRKKDQDEIDSYNGLLKVIPEGTDTSGIQSLISSFQDRVNKADSINNNYKKLENLAFINVAKYTGITESREKLEVNESEDNFEFADKDTENPTDFYTDVYAESPDNKVTYSMRRFFGNVRQYDKDGNQMVGTLSTPLYTNSSEIIRALQVGLVDTPSDFKSMMDKLGTLKDKYPWMQAVINKLSDTTLSEQKKNQFVAAMSFTKLRMVHSTLAFNRYTNTWNIRVDDTNTNGVADIVKKSWKNNLIGNPDYNLFVLNEDSNYILNNNKAKSLMNTFEDWSGLNIPTLQSDLSQFKKHILNVSSNSNTTITPTGGLLDELRSKIVKGSDRMQFSMSNRNFQITSSGNGKYKISSLDRQLSPKSSEITKWLDGFGIVLTPKTVDELQSKGLFHNTKLRTPKQLMETGANTNGLYGILYNELKALVSNEGTFDFSEYGKNPLDNSVISSLANLEGRYNTTDAPIGFRVNKKTYFALTSPKFATDRGLELTGNDSVLRDNLSQISFSHDSLWLKLLQDQDFRTKFGVYTDSAETLKEKGKKSYKDKAGVVDLSAMDQEIAKTSKFFDMTRGDIIYGDKSNRYYPDSKISLRMAMMQGLTSSDKSIMLDFNTAVLNLTSTDLKDGMSDTLTKAIYEQTVRPELMRMIKFAKNGGNTNITSYNEGAKIFFIIPEMNNIMITDRLRLTDAIAANPLNYDEKYIENNDSLMKSINSTIKKSIEGLVKKKLEVWNEIGIKEVNDKQGNKYINFVDNKYLNKFGNATNEEKIKYAAMDYEINSLIANANNMMLFSGDPALYYKSKSIDVVDKIKDTAINLTKRLANQIAPAHKLANSKGDKYLQLFIQDRKSTSNNIDYLEKLYGKDKVSAFRDINAADAQEYTTWKEHLDNLTRLGKTADSMMDITPEDINIARRLISSGKDFSDREMEIVRQVMQPLKPRYTGQIYDKNQDVMRTVYIKSSSFPLIPQLTKGFEIDKLRKKMEEIEKKGLNVRASHQTANKVGSMNNAAKIWNEDGTINDEALSNIQDSSLELDREGYGIQQEVPYKSYKSKTDTVTLGTQLMKLLFGDGVMNIGKEVTHEDGTKTITNPFTMDGKEYTGKQLHEQYTNAFIDLLELKQGQIFDELGLDENGTPIDKEATTTKLQKLLNDEAVKRSYPLQDIKALKLDKNTSDFILPLWASVNSNRFESMLNSIISNRMVALKLPGTSLVTGSEEGFSTGGIPVVDSRDITSYEGTKGAAQYSNGQIKVNRELLQEKYNDKAWTNPRKLIETLHGNTIESFADALPKEQFKTYKEWENFVINHEYNHSLYTRADFNKEHPDGTKGQYETIINNRALSGKYNYNGSKAEEDDLTNKEKSNIIFTSGWNGKELQATFSKDGKLQMAQVFLPSKFRDNDGELVDLLSDKYTNNDNGHITLKQEMFDKDLLNSLSFRIPTSGHQSGSRIEIAGFLPHTMGDLIIVPKTFTTQKGLDFDIDKENLYNLWTRMNKDGKFEVLDKKHRSKVLDEATRQDNEGLMQDTADKLAPEYNQDEIDNDSKLKTANTKFNEKLLHNKIIKITRSVYEHPSDEMQSKINKTLDTKYAEKQANMIDKFINQKNKDEIWSPLSSEYQKNAMLAGSSGKTGTGAYSLDVVSHSLFQQALASGKAIALKETTRDKEGNTTVLNKTFRFGKLEEGGVESYSDLGKEKTVDGSRSIADVNAERQNISVDNATLGIMGKVNLNDLTMDVDKVLNMTGIDKGKDGNSISFLFLSQPIIKEYVAQMKNANSIMASFDNDKEIKIVNSLISKYDPREDEQLESDYNNIMADQMTNENFITAIQTESPNGRLQAAILKRFIELKAYGIEIRGVQTALNFKNNSLGKSFFDVIEKKNALNKIGNGSPSMTNIDALVGDFISVEDANDLPKEYVNIGSYYVKPTTVIGAFNVKATMTAYNLWGKYFPFDTNEMKATFKQIVDTIGSGDMSATKTVELKQEVFRHIKKYLSSSNQNGIVSNDDNVNNERKRLYVDSETNTSLARYLYKALQINNDDVVNKYLKTNKLINSFEFNLNKDGQPSIIRYNNASGEQFDEQYLYEGLSQLLKNIGKDGTLPLPKIGNKEYTLDKLAQDLIAYTFLGNSTQEAIQFAKFIPVSYLNTVGYSNWLKNNLEYSLAKNVNIDKPDNNKHLIGEFPMQFIQHNANKVKLKYDNNNWQNNTKSPTFDGKNTLDNLQTFQLGIIATPSFVSIYNRFGKTKKDKQQLYWYDGSKYTRVSTLGTFGMDEYQLGQGIGKSIVNGNNKLKIQPQDALNKTSTEQQANDPFNVASKSVSTVLSNITNANIPGLSELAKIITPFIGETTIDTATAIAGNGNFNGMYLHDSNAILINNKMLEDANLDKKAQVVIEEVIHSLTANQIKKYITQNVDGTVDTNINAPSYVTDIVRLYNYVRVKVDTKELQDILGRIEAKLPITDNEFNTKYGLTDIYEFMAQTFANKEFQKYLAKDEFKQSGQTFLEKFRAAVLNLLDKMGINFSNDTATVQAFNSIFEFIEKENTKSNISKENQKMKEDVDNFDEDTFYSDNDSIDFSPSTFPNKTLNVIEEKCI